VLLTALSCNPFQQDLTKDPEIRWFYTHATSANDLLLQNRPNQAKLALDSAETLLEYVEDAKAYRLLGFYYQNLARYYELANHPLEMYTNYYKAIAQFERTEENYFSLPIYYNLAFMYYQKEDAENLHLIIEKATPIAWQSDDPLDKIILNELHSYYFTALVGKGDDQPAFMDSIIFYELQVVEQFERHSDIHERKKDGISFNYARLADNMLKKGNTSATQIGHYIDKAQEWGIPTDTTMLVNCLSLRGRLAYQQTNYTQAESFLLQANALRNEYSNKRIHSMYPEIIYYLSLVAEKLGNYRLALAYDRERNELMTDVNVHKESQLADNLHFKMELQRRELQIEHLTKINAMSITMKWLFVAIAVLLTLALIFLYAYFLQKRRLSDTYVARLEKQVSYSAKTNQMQLEEISKMTKRISTQTLELTHLKEALQLYSSPQTVAAISGQEIFINPKVTDPFFQAIYQDTYSKIKRRLNPRLKATGNYLDTLERIDNEFFLRLQGNTSLDLSALMMQYCLSFAIGMDIKDVAECLCVEPETVRITRYRLKQKFPIDDKTDFKIFLKQMIN
jgi:hypothetical protein